MTRRQRLEAAIRAVLDQEERAIDAYAREPREYRLIVWRIPAGGYEAALSVETARTKV